MSEIFSNSVIDIDQLPQYEEVELNPVSQKLRTKSIMRWIITNLILIGGGTYLLLTNEIEPFVWIGVGLFGLLMLVNLLDIFLRQKYYGFALREKDILFRSGYISTKKMIVPFNRVQHSAIHQSFLDKIFGIASLKIYTAGGSGSDMRIPGLLPDLAENLNEVLSEKVAAR